MFTGIVELAGITFQGEPAKNKKQAEKNAAQAAWLSLKQCKLSLLTVMELFCLSMLPPEPPQVSFCAILCIDLYETLYFIMM